MIVMHEEYSEEIFESKKPKDIDMINFGMMMGHNMPCPVYADTNIAVFNGNTGVFGPSGKAKSEGWRMVQVKPGREWLWNLIGKYLFEHWTVFSDITAPIKQQSNQGN